MLRHERIYQTKLLIPGVSEKILFLVQSTVPTSGTGALADKAKTCKAKPTKGTRQISPVA